VDGPRAASESFAIVWNFTDTGDTFRLTLSNGALIQTPNPKTTIDPDLELTLTKHQLLGLLAGQGLDGIDHQGDAGVLGRLLALLDTPDRGFPIVTP
jgi:alkyl sulfatase BDS1-like metallo-beta-lactamase superfamily hydrolase